MMWRAFAFPTFHNVLAGIQPMNNKQKNTMLYTVAVVLIVLWVLGLVSGTAIGSFIHVLLAIAVIMILVSFISGRRTGL